MSTRSCEKRKSRSTESLDSIPTTTRTARLSIQSETVSSVHKEARVKKSPSNASNREGRTRKQSTQPVIDENKVLDTSTENQTTFQRHNSKTNSISSSKHSIKKNSRIERPVSLVSDRVSIGGISNPGFTRGSQLDVYDGTASQTSLPVFREQYCSCMRWSKTEKVLMAIIVIMSLIIIGLLVTMSIWASRRRLDDAFDRMLQEGGY